MTLRPLYAFLSKRWSVTRLDLLGMTGRAPSSMISARKSSPSYALSAMSARMLGASAKTLGAAMISASWPGEQGIADITMSTVGGNRVQRDLIANIAAYKQMPATDLTKIKSILRRCSKAARKRNTLVHALYLIR